MPCLRIFLSTTYLQCVQPASAACHKVDEGSYFEAGRPNPCGREHCGLSIVINREAATAGGARFGGGRPSSLEESDDSSSMHSLIGIESVLAPGFVTVCLPRASSCPDTSAAYSDANLQEVHTVKCPFQQQTSM